MDGHYNGKQMKAQGMWRHGTPVPGGGAAKHHMLPSVQPSFATEDAMKKQEQTKNPELVGCNEPTEGCKCV